MNRWARPMFAAAIGAPRLFGPASASAPAENHSLALDRDSLGLACSRITRYMLERGIVMKVVPQSG
ncbi:hypothetical protein NKI76_31120, partial [Mesorhizobium sp. M0435]